MPGNLAEWLPKRAEVWPRLGSLTPELMTYPWDNQELERACVGTKHLPHGWDGCLFLTSLMTFSKLWPQHATGLRLFCSSGQKPLGSGQRSYFTRQLGPAMSSSPTALGFWQFACWVLCLFFYHVRVSNSCVLDFEATKSQAVAVPLCSPAPSHPALSICDMLRISLDVKATMLAYEIENYSHSLLAFHSQAGGSDSSCSLHKRFLSSQCRSRFLIVAPFTDKRLPRVGSTKSPWPASRI